MNRAVGGVPADQGVEPRVRGGLGIYDAPEPWGPWTTVYFAEDWDVGPGESAGLPTRWMSADGRVLHRQDQYHGPADWQAIRKVDPNYDPSRDPDVTKPKTSVINVSPFLVLGGTILLLLFVTRVRVDGRR